MWKAKKCPLSVLNIQYFRRFCMFTPVATLFVKISLYFWRFCLILVCYSVLIPAFGYISKAQPTIACPSLPSSSCPSVNWTSTYLTVSVPLTYRSLVDGSTSVVNCDIGVEVCYRCCNGVPEVYIGNIDATGCDRLGYSLALSAIENTASINKKVLETVLPLIGACGTNIPPCGEGQLTYTANVVRSICYKKTGTGGLYLQACADEGYCTFTYTVCYMWDPIQNLNYYIVTAIGSSSSSVPCSVIDPWLVNPNVCHTICN